LGTLAVVLGSIGNIGSGIGSSGIGSGTGALAVAKSGAHNE